ncbi:type VI immunity family protein [Cystobacter fuscus]
MKPKERTSFEDYPAHKARSAEKDGADPFFILHGARESGYCFDYRARIPFRETPPNFVSVLRVTLPTEYLEEQGPGFMREWVLHHLRPGVGRGRAVVALGPWPEAGDLRQGQTLPAYRELARVLEPWLEPFDPGFLLLGAGG